MIYDEMLDRTLLNIAPIQYGTILYTINIFNYISNFYDELDLYTLNGCE